MIENSSMLVIRLLGWTLCFSLAFYSLSAAKEKSVQSFKDRAASAVIAMKKSLKGELEKAIQNGGPENALEVCKVKAPEIAEEVSTNGLRIGRTSHRLRNPANQPEPWMLPVLKEYQKTSMAQPGEARILETNAGRNVYVEPIYVDGPCLTCHGSSLSKEFKHKLQELYPRDQATGFQPGEFRGMFWVESSP